MNKNLDLQIMNVLIDLVVDTQKKYATGRLADALYLSQYSEKIDSLFTQKLNLLAEEIEKNSFTVLQGYNPQEVVSLDQVKDLIKKELR